MKNLREQPTLINWRNFVLIPDKTRPHSAGITQEKILDFNWSVLLHPAYLPNTEPSNFHLFLSQQNALNDKKISQKDQVKMFVENLGLKSSEFYLIGINKLNDKWQEVTQINGKYTIDWN